MRFVQEDTQILLRPFPDQPDLVPLAFLTNILRQNGCISDETEVVDFDKKKLKGGVHFSVIKAILRYSTNSGSDVDKRPKSIVLKMINGGKSMRMWSKFLLWLKMKWDAFPFLPASIDELAYRLRGYRIELRFYRRYADQVAIPVPRCYYNYEDFYNVHFVTILEDLSDLANGEPDGFKPAEAKLLLENVAALHAKFWKSPYFQEPPGEVIKPSIWQHGGYWFGNKEMPHSKSVTESYETVLKNFKSLSLHDAKSGNPGKKFGKRLDKIVENLTSAVHRLTPRTMIHGDYKIANIFLDRAKSRVVTIDWQWMGGGCCATDVAYLMYTSVAIEEQLPNHTLPSAEVDKLMNKYPYYERTEIELLHAYHTALVKMGIEGYSFELFEKQYLTNVIYFLVFCLRQKYSNMTHDDVLRYKRNNEDGLHLRSFTHIKQLFQRSSILIKQLEKYLVEENSHWQKHGDSSSDYAQWKTSKMQ